MEKALIKMARQLRSLDEASLTSLWEKYAEIVRGFEPSERWEEAVLVLSFIQSVRMKNQLFNHQWAGAVRQLEPAGPKAGEPDGRGRPATSTPEAQPGQALGSGLPARDASGHAQLSGGRSGGNGQGAGSGSGPARGAGVGKRGKLIRFRSRDEA